tara:strand:+ start:209 stop:643 length:435 start_codon:yes stop_codon:yes gene_type:complete
MDRRLRILQRQARKDVAFSDVPQSLVQYISMLERLAGVESISTLHASTTEDLVEGFLELGDIRKMKPLALRVARILNANEYEATLEGLASINPRMLARQRGMGYMSMLAASEVLANSGMLNQEWTAFLMRNSDYLEGRGHAQRY